MNKHCINDAIVRDGKLVLSDLPLADGQHVRILVAENEEQPALRISIDEVRTALRGGVERYDDTFEPYISLDSWEMLK